MQTRNNQKETSCPLCGSNSLTPFWEKESAGLLLCETCSFAFLSPLPTSEELSKYYEQEYFEKYRSVGEARNYFQMKAGNLSEEFRRLKLLQRYCRNGKLLEVGCAGGFFLKVAKEAGFAVEGVEISDFAAGYARNDLGLNARTGDFTQLDFTPESFDAVVMWDTLEHCVNPKEQLDQAEKLLKPGGTLALSMPNVACWNARRSHTHWRYYIPPEHVGYFSAASLKHALQAKGFEILATESYFMYHAFLQGAEQSSPLKILLPLLKLLRRPLQKISLHNLNCGPRFGDILYCFARKT